MVDVRLRPDARVAHQGVGNLPRYDGSTPSDVVAFGTRTTPRDAKIEQAEDPCRNKLVETDAKEYQESEKRKKESLN